MNIWSYMAIFIHCQWPRRSGTIFDYKLKITFRKALHSLILHMSICFHFRGGETLNAGLLVMYPHVTAMSNERSNSREAYAVLFL